MPQEIMQDKPFGLMCSTNLEPSPVISNVTDKHDRLHNALDAVTNEKEVEELVRASTYLWNERTRIALATGVPCANGLSHAIIENLLKKYNIPTINFDTGRYITIRWSITDVQALAVLTDEEAWDVLVHVRDGHDANEGVSYATLQYWIDELYPSAKGACAYEPDEVHTFKVGDAVRCVAPVTTLGEYKEGDTGTVTEVWADRVYVNWDIDEQAYSTVFSWAHEL